MTRIVIADDHGLVREALRILLHGQDAMEVVADVPDGLLAIEAVRVHRPDVLLINVSMPVLNGIDAARQISKEFPACRILALSESSDECFLFRMLDAGAHGYVLKTCVCEELVTAIRTVARGERYLSTEITQIVINGYVAGRRSDPLRVKINSLTLKERQLLQLLTEGNSNKGAARLLNITTKTIDARRRAIMDKLHLYSISSLTKFAIREGITSLDS